jgi:hypothetical protein
MTDDESLADAVSAWTQVAPAPRPVAHGARHCQPRRRNWQGDLGIVNLPVYIEVPREPEPEPEPEPVNALQRQVDAEQRLPGQRSGSGDWDNEIEPGQVQKTREICSTSLCVVYYAKWKGQDVVVKQFSSSLYQSAMRGGPSFCLLLPAPPRPAGSSAWDPAAALSSGRRAGAEFQAEVAVLRKVKSPRTVLFIGSCCQEGAIFIAMEAMRMSLFDYLHKMRGPPQPLQVRRPRPPPEVTMLCEACCHYLAAHIALCAPVTGVFRVTHRADCLKPRYPARAEPKGCEAVLSHPFGHGGGAAGAEGLRHRSPRHEVGQRAARRLRPRQGHRLWP